MGGLGDTNRADYQPAGAEPLCYEAKGKVIALPYWQALSDPRVSPSRGLAKGALPPSFIICGTADDLLPESRAMSEAMNKAGIEHELHVVDEMPHAFMQMGALSDCRKGFSLISDFLARHV